MGCSLNKMGGGSALKNTYCVGIIMNKYFTMENYSDSCYFRVYLIHRYHRKILVHNTPTANLRQLQQL